MSMKFLIVSDTHGRMYNLEEAMEREEFDGMIHCGDVEGMDDLIKSKVNGPCYITTAYRSAWRESMRRRFPGVWISYCSAIRTGRSQKSVEISGLSIRAASRIRVRWEENQAMPC